jgi:hypothetical protein
MFLIFPVSLKRLLIIDISVQDADRALRLRENKRRNRQRQKDYTAELRSKLQQLQSEGIKATQEVQLSARRVVEDNLRLKALLRFKGVDDHTINTWTPEGDISNNPTVKMESGIMTVCRIRSLAAIISKLNRLGKQLPPSNSRRLDLAM